MTRRPFCPCRQATSARSGSPVRALRLGYWNRREESAATFAAQCADLPNVHYLRTGDLGFLDEGELFIAPASRI